MHMHGWWSILHLMSSTIGSITHLRICYIRPLPNNYTYRVADTTHSTSKLAYTAGANGHYRRNIRQVQYLHPPSSAVFDALLRAYVNSHPIIFCPLLLATLSLTTLYAQLRQLQTSENMWVYTIFKGSFHFLD